MKKCPICGIDSVRVIYYGLPHWLCGDEKCGCLFGFWLNLTGHLPFNGVYLEYTCGYWEALWYWLTNNEDNIQY